MYGLPSNANLSFFEGKTLLQACFGENDLILRFTGGISVAIYSCIGVGLAETQIQRVTAFEEAAVRILGLLNREVAGVSWTTEGTVSLSFEAGQIVELYDDSREFESYSISYPAGDLIV